MSIEDRDPAADEVEAAEAESAPRSTRSQRRSRRRADKKATKKHLPVWQESILLLAVALVLAVVIKAFFVQAFYIPSESMEPGLVKNDRILVEKWSYWGSATPQRGDVVVFKDPGGWLDPSESNAPSSLFQKALEKVGLYPSGGHLVKRVIGVAGDTVVCCDDEGRISVNGVPLNEPYLKNQARCNGPMVSPQCQRDWKAGPVPAGKIFVMGDHRDMSADSSYHLKNPGPTYVSASLVVGKVFVLVWPRDHFGWIKRPATFEDIPDAS
ncbi:signal peptidase I [Nocardioides sp.]|uniref:signal peptidase I n=1 Tax=Nocardioides sp. TaxID=35761 RepID=UPI003D0D9838